MDKCKDCGKEIERPRDGRCDDCIEAAYVLPSHMKGIHMNKHLMTKDPTQDGEQEEQDPIQVQINEVLVKVDQEILEDLKEKRDQILAEIGRLEDLHTKVAASIDLFEDGISAFKEGLNELNDALNGEDS